uniref:Uncharacterized protein n=1 Tax=Anguilla anguilla TaxID=7936 RepID=A0A0E9SZW8_ANGAN
MTTVIKCFLKHTSITWVYFSIAEGSPPSLQPSP